MTKEWILSRSAAKSTYRARDFTSMLAVAALSLAVSSVVFRPDS